ncbi:hypothetical protein Lesp02_31990 [Lentzea sp. NBRC 105346]|uniref:DUF7144 family membrane protein n=1 Tax=Lentzea sp. NBRC 105346 TaxID=3032205 RepID=UPI0024A45CD3|nr:hypothetical protein [Lentzea sp. NBRC 105346]GLZ31010.1 hypothetical protein Lesp02_31990 [Lentzea sp. NBRC 105346]
MTKQTEYSTDTRWAAGFALFAGVLMVCVGIYQGLAGLVALFRNEFYVVTDNYLYSLDVTSWGWIHLVLGILIALTGFGVVRGALWARIAGITLAGLSMIANFVFLPYYPLWSMLIIAFDVVVVWALCSYKAD